MSAEKDVPPKMNEECANVLKSIVSALDSPLSYQQTQARALLDVLYEKKCKEALGWIHEKYGNHPAAHVQKIAQRAQEFYNRL
jgi:hypothetical protein